MALTLVTSPKQTNYNLDPIYLEVETDLIDGSGDPSEPNLSCYIQVFDNAVMIGELNVPFDRLTKKAFADLSGLMDVRAALPDDIAMEDYATGVADAARTKLSLNYAEMFGDPVVVPTTLASTDEFYVLHGSSPYWYGLGPDPTPNRILHSYITPEGRYAVKELRVNQPEFVYYFINTGSVSISWEIEYTDGTTDTGSAPEDPSSEAGAINWVNIGFSATGAADAADPDKSIHLYKVNFSGVSGENTMYYHIDDHDTTHDMYICYDNGIGGIEVLRCSGRHEFGVSGRRDVYRKARVMGSNHRDGMMGVSTSVAAVEMQLNTGFYSENYIRHLGQLVMGDCWLIDLARTKFVKCMVKDSSLKLINRADDLHSLSFTIMMDEKPGVSTFLQ